MTRSDNDMSARVKQANRDFYDRAVDIYDEVDGRRTGELIGWLSDRLKHLSEITDGEILLDLGCGSGIVLEVGSKHFKRTLGMDISPEILKTIKGANGLFCGDADLLPLKDNSVDAVVCFAVLHHIYDPLPLIKEAYRVLKPGGAFYSDHDIDILFMNRFGIPMWIYRKIFDAGKKYVNSGKGISREDYDLAEVHSDGVESPKILKGLKGAGFSTIDPFYHWYGLSGPTNKLFKYKRGSAGYAPLFSVIARK